MCGISGVINKENISVENQLIKSMNDRISHRGPDGEGFFFGANFAFGHRRLSILDLSSDGSQPMVYHEKNVITFNGEIYNYIELRDELKEKGYQFYTQTDTEVILAAYDCWGEHCVERFNGMWSFVIYDKERNKLFASRDRFGVKPFYYTVSESLFAFGSEIRQLLPLLPQRKANQQILLDYLITSIEEHTNETFFEGIHKLQQGSNLIYDLSNHSYEIKKFYSLQLTDYSTVSEEKAVELYKNQLTSAVNLRMRSDVEVGTCLSGGLDSSSITALSAESLRNASTERIKAIHAKANEKEIDESEFATMVAQHTDSNLIFVAPSYDDFQTNINAIIETQEEPFGSP